MNIKIAAERIADKAMLYFFDDEVMNEYMAANGGEDAYEFMGFQIVPKGAEVIDTDEWRAGFMAIAAGTGIDVSKLKKHEIHGMDDPEETEEQRDARMKESMDIKNRAAVFRINEYGQLEETDEDIEEVAKAKSAKRVEDAITVLKKKCEDLDMDPEEIMGEGTDGERFNRLADAVWDKMKELGQVKDEDVNEDVMDELDGNDNGGEDED